MQRMIQKTLATYKMTFHKTAIYNAVNVMSHRNNESEVLSDNDH